jgi:hypothetical protein
MMMECQSFLARVVRTGLMKFKKLPLFSPLKLNMELFEVESGDKAAVTAEDR